MAPSTDDLTAALIGDWAGVLEYRDYAEPASSTKRVELPTWLSITPAPGGMHWHYIYDDGPNKVVDESETVTIDRAAGTFTEAEPGKPPRSSQVTGYDQLRDGHGELVLAGIGTDNDSAAELRTTLTIRRNLLTLVETTRPASSADPFVFRHAYRLTRAQPPRAGSR